MFNSLDRIIPKYIKGKKNTKPFRFMLNNPLQGDKAQVDLTPAQAEKVLTKCRKYETIELVSHLKVWIAEHLRKHHR